LLSSANPSSFGAAITFTATVTAVAPAFGTPSGTVTFKDGATFLGTGALNASAQATFATATLSIAGHTITAVYGGDTNFTGGTSTAVAQTVNKASTSTAVVSSQNPADSGQSVTFTATVTATAPGAGIPTGTVSFFDGVKSLATIILNSQGKASFTTSSLSIGT